MLTSRMLAPAFDLLAGDGHGLLELPVEDQPGELLRAGDVRPLADHHEIAVGPQRQRLQAAQARQRLGLRARCAAARRPRPRRSPGCGPASCRSSRRRCSASRCAANSPSVRGHHLGRFVEAAEGVRQAGVRIATDVDRRDLRQLFDIGPQLVGPQAQLMPTLSKSACEIEFQQASTVWAESVRPPSKIGERGHHRQAARRGRRNTFRWRTGRP